MLLLLLLRAAVQLGIQVQLRFQPTPKEAGRTPRWLGDCGSVTVHPEQATADGRAAAGRACTVAASLARWNDSLGKGTGAMVSGACTTAAGTSGSPKPTTCQAVLQIRQTSLGLQDKFNVKSHATRNPVEHLLADTRRRANRACSVKYVPRQALKHCSVRAMR